MIKVSAVIPARNEEDYIKESVSSLLHQSYPMELFEIIVVDGGSSDRTREIVREFQREWPNVSCLDNPAGIVPTAMNIGIRSARGEIIVRADAHNVYPHDYIENSVKYLECTGADNVGGPCITVPADNSFSANLVVAILTNPFGVGNSHFRISMREEFVDTVPFGAFRKDIFGRVGLYNEKLVRNQDNDLNARIRKAGGRIYQTSALMTQYYPVKTFRRLLGKVFEDSQWHIFTLSENKDALGLRHLVPAFFVLALMSLLFLVFVNKLALFGLGVVLAVYFVVGFYYGNRTASKYGGLLAVAMPFAFLCFHVSYGCGTLVGLRWLFRPPPSRPIRA